MQEAYKKIERDKFGRIKLGTVPPGFVVVGSSLGPEFETLAEAEKIGRWNEAAKHRYD